MKINLIPRVNPINKIHYKLTHKYKPIVKKEIEGMLVVSNIYLVEKLEWASLMDVEAKKHD